MGAAVTALAVKSFGEKHPKAGKQGAAWVVVLQSMPRALLSIISGSSWPLPCCKMALNGTANRQSSHGFEIFHSKSEWEGKIMASFLFHAIKAHQVFQPH